MLLSGRNAGRRLHKAVGLYINSIGGRMHCDSYRCAQLIIEDFLYRMSALPEVNP